MKLISMTYFVLEQKENTPYLHYSSNSFSFVKKVLKYAQFLKQPLDLWMFAPCDEDGNVLEVPKKENYTKEELENSELGYDFYDYQKAKERCLFEGFELIHKYDKHYKQALIAKNKYGVGQFDIYDYKTIEDLMHMNLTLTPTAIKQIGL